MGQTVKPPEDIIDAWPGLVVGEPLLGGHRNAVFAGLLHGERVAVRHSRRSTASLDWELALLRDLERDGFGVASPIPTATSSWHHQHWVVQRWVDGREPTSDADWHQVADTLAAVHQWGARRGQRPDCCALSELPTVGRSVDAVWHALPPEVRHTLKPLLETSDALSHALIHGDPGPANIRIDGDQVVLLDWDESRVDVCVLDLANLGTDVLTGTALQHALLLADAWETANGWADEPAYANRRFADLRTRLQAADNQ